MKYGYARTSTTEQNPEAQIAALESAGCDVIRTEQKSGTKLEGRTELQTLLDFMRPGDVLVCARIDRLARSIADLQTIVQTLKSKGVALQCTEQPVDTTTAAGKCFLDMLGVFAEFESNLRKDRQMAGIQNAKAKGVYKGRPRQIDREEIRAMKASGMSAIEISNRMGIARAHVYRCLKD
ncbi:recombinase family protein [Gluconobacter japonicus]|uniref:Integrase-like protein y4lS n=1 Tax=Gluconobacter japonicus TaxID=376620 RepID=A0ABQ5WIM1_GLUJA|nr:recombinase family protein [Gluconobacter japonicus]KXV30009.1 integrase [Gluconobacter japonicus]GBR26659.1 DNA resolvase [Gluconobacter japonicus NBRC 3271]GLQ59621.1 integrase-like protein y4lS [Gluconobacter japonicus]